LLTRHASALNALRIGRNNFSFERLSDVDRQALEALIAEAAAVFKNDPANAARYRSGLASRETR